MKKLFNLFLVFCLTFILTGCGNPKAIVLFNQKPITKETLLDNATKFVPGKRIYYIFISEEPIESSAVRIRIMKRDEKMNMTFSKLVYSNDFRLQKDQVYYYNDYIVINESGYYAMLVYATNRLDKPISIGYFRVAD